MDAFEDHEDHEREEAYDAGMFYSFCFAGRTSLNVD